MLSTHNKKRTPFGVTAVLAAAILFQACGLRDPHFSLLGEQQGIVTSGLANNKVDILWVIDNSGTMGPKQTNLINSINSFMDSFVNLDFDYHIAVATTDISATGQNACIVGAPAIVTSSTPNPNTAVANNANVGFFGSADAHGLDVVQAALSDPNLSGCNAGFLRPDAFLAVIFFSDADDDTAATVENLEAFLDTLKPPFTLPNGTSVHAWSASAMVVNNVSDPNCIALGPASELGTKYMQLANDSNGQIASICAGNFSAGLLSVATKILQATTAIHLKREPDPSTIGVVMNGKFIEESPVNGWQYDASINSIVFYGNAIPNGPGITIDIFYTPNDLIH